MTGYQNKVIHLAGEQQKGEVQLVVNLFQSVLDGFIRGEIKKEEAEPAKVRHSRITESFRSNQIKQEPGTDSTVVSVQPVKARKKRRKKDKSVSDLTLLQFNYSTGVLFQ